MAAVNKATAHSMIGIVNVVMNVLNAIRWLD